MFVSNEIELPKLFQCAVCSNRKSIAGYYFLLGFLSNFNAELRIQFFASLVFLYLALFSENVRKKILSKTKQNMERTRQAKHFIFNFVLETDMKFNK